MGLRWMPRSDGCHGAMGPPRRLVGLGCERWWQPMARRRRERWWRPLVRRGRRGRRGMSEFRRWWRRPMRSLGNLATPGRWRRRWPMMDGGTGFGSVLECRGAREGGGEGGRATVMRERGGDGRLECACQPAEIGPPLLHELREEHSSAAHEAVGVAKSVRDLKCANSWRVSRKLSRQRGCSSMESRTFKGAERRSQGRCKVLQ